MNISLREKIYLIVAAVIILPIIIYRFVVSPLNDMRDNLDARTKQLILSENRINFLSREIQFFQGAAINQNFKADTVLRKILSDMDLASDAQINSIQGSSLENRFKITLNELRHDQLALLIYNIENNTPVMKITRLIVSRAFRNRDQRIKAEIEILS